MSFEPRGVYEACECGVSIESPRENAPARARGNTRRGNPKIPFVSISTKFEKIGNEPPRRCVCGVHRSADCGVPLRQG